MDSNQNGKESTNVRLDNVAELGNLELARKLIHETEIDVNRCRENNKAQLNNTMNNIDVEMVKQLLETNANIKVSEKLELVTIKKKQNFKESINVRLVKAVESCRLYLLLEEPQNMVKLAIFRLELVTITRNPNVKESINVRLVKAVESGDLELASKLLCEPGIYVNQCLEYDRTLLYIAVNNNDVKMVKLLLEHNANPNLSEKLYYSKSFAPLWTAVKNCYYKIAELLIQAGARLRQTIRIHEEIFDMLYLHAAAQKHDERMVELLLSHGADVNEHSHIGYSPLHLALRRRCELSMVEMLIKYGADINDVEERFEVAPLLTAISTVNERVVRLLVDKGANVNAISVYGHAPLYLAVKHGSPSIVKLLLSKGADVNQKTLKGQTALHMACMKESVPKIRMLVESGADLTIKEFIGDRTPFFMIKDRSSPGAKMMVRQIIKAIEFGKIVAEEDIKAIQMDENLRTIHHQCILEIQRMQTFKVYNNISIYHIFSKHETKLAPLLRNRDFIKAYVCEDLKSSFLDYGTDLDRKIKKAEPIMKSQLKMENYLNDALGCYLPVPLLIRIANFCNPDDFLC